MTYSIKRIRNEWFYKFTLVTYLGIVSTFTACNSVESKTNPPLKSMITNDSIQIATFGAGCFWCVEAVFAELKGVISVTPGYCGGKTQNPSYKEVCSGTSGHAEVAQIIFDPRQISFMKLLEVFFQTHDPTTLNRQGNDVGSQYRSAIFYSDESQKEEALKTIKELNQSGAWTKEIVTEVSPSQTFYPAEQDHREYYKNNPEAGYCRYVIQPKMDKFRKVFGDLLK